MMSKNNLANAIGAILSDKDGHNVGRWSFDYYKQTHSVEFSVEFDGQNDKYSTVLKKTDVIHLIQYLTAIGQNLGD